MSVVRRRKKHNPYTPMDLTALDDTRLSFRAKGLHCYLMSRPDDWKVYIAQLEKESPTEGREAIAHALKELEKAGYLKRTRLQGEHGRMAGWDTVVYETPDLANEDATSTENGLAEVGKTVIGATENGLAEVGKTATTYYVFNQELNTPLPPNGGDDTKAQESTKATSKPHANGTGRVLAAQAQHILAYLNSLLSRHYKIDKHIRARLAQGYTVSDCKLVLDWLHVDRRRREPEWVEKYLDHTTPFREDNFDKYLQRATEWDAKGRPMYKNGAPDTPHNTNPYEFKVQL